MASKIPPVRPVINVVQREGISAIWLVPLLALIFGAWLLVKGITEQGIFITVQFDHASGIVAGKTQVRYKGLTAGIVTALEVSEDLNSVVATIEMVPSTKAMLTDNTVFWYVTADITLQGVSGLDTLLSGSFINVKPDILSEGDAKRHFIALNEEPLLDNSAPGLHLTLTSQTLGSLARNSPITFKQIKVGHVVGFNYNEADQQVNINVFIEPEYAHLIKENSRFWNASGIKASGSFSSGVEIHADSLASVIAGGIAFDNAKHDDVLPAATSGQHFTLYSNYETAKMGHEINLILPWNSGIDRGAVIKFQEFTLGYISSLGKLDTINHTIAATAKVDPRLVPYLTEDSQFFVVTPKVDLAGVTNLHSLLTGSHLSILGYTTGEPTNTFTVLNQKPAYQYSEPGLHLVLNTPNIGSLMQGSGIFYQQQKVGSIQAIENDNSGNFLLHIHVKPEYQNHVNTDSRFWHASGFRITGGLQHFAVQAQSVQSILTGGIAFDLGDNSKTQKPKNGDEFTLYENIDTAKQRINFIVNTTTMQGINNHTRIIHRGETIGSVHQIIRTKTGVQLHVGVLPEYYDLLNDTSQFWLVKPQLTLSGLTDTEALFGGAYIAFSSGEGSPKNEFWLLDTPPKKALSTQGLQLTLIAKHGTAVSPGSPINYLGLTIGQVDHVALNESKNSLEINITVDDNYRAVINDSTRFYNASGISVSGGLSGLVFNTASVDAIIRGGISLYNPKNIHPEISIVEGQSFTLFDNRQHAETAGLTIAIHFDESQGLHDNLKVKYKNHQLGTVDHLVFDQDNMGATAIVLLNDIGKKYAVDDTKFWYAATEIGLVANKHVDALLDGGFISLLPGASSEQRVSFQAKSAPPVVKQLNQGVNLTLTASRVGSIRVGDPVLYRQIKVGRVIGVDLSPMADQVNIFINLEPRYSPLVTESSKFWHSSGISVTAGLFTGIRVETESVETLLAGGIAFATPEASDNPIPASFILYDEADPKWPTWQPKIPLINE